MKINVNKYKYDEWQVPLSVYFDEFIVSRNFPKLCAFTITKNIFSIIFYTNLWVTIWYKFLTGIIQTIFETHQLYINMQNFIRNIFIIYIIYIYNDSNSVNFSKILYFKHSTRGAMHYKLDYKVIIHEISNFYKSKLIECKI